jgi:protein phosphatase PTC7
MAALTSDKARQYGPAAVVKAVYEAADLNNEIGASTACVIGMDSSGRLYGVNLGDSGVLIVRDGKKLFRTKEQQHQFNCPYQLSSVTNTDTMAMGQTILQKTRPGDIVILATDGLFDNIDTDKIVQIAADTESSTPLADRLADVATTNSMNKSYVSPFQRSAIKAGVKWMGGKIDDITIVCLTVVDDPDLKPTNLLSTMPESTQGLEVEQS